MRSLAIILLFALFTSACSFSSSNPEAYSDFKPIEVRVYLPDTVTDGGIQTIYAHVSQDGEDIIDAELVRFEVWSSTHEQHEWLATTNEGNGMYAAEVDFTEEGLYFAKALTQVGDLYAMPTKRFAVGKLTPEEANQLINGNQQPYANDHSHH